MTPLIGFAPDADQAMPGILSDCTNLVPFVNGMEGGPSAVTPSDVPALAAACLGAAVVTNQAGTRRVYAGTTTHLYELSGGSWTDRSSATYTGGGDTRWSFAQFGDATLAANRADAMQRSTGGAFAAVAGAPKAEIIFSVGSQLMALNVNDGAEKTNGWHCCAIFDDTDWATSVTTQAASGRLVATPGAILAGARLGEYAVAYKEKSIYLGQYVGAPVVWDWTPVVSDVGCVGKEAICDIGDAHFFVGEDDFYLFDGTRPVAIGDGVIRQWFIANRSPTYKYRIKCAFDKPSGRVFVHFPSIGATACDMALVYHVKTKRWGRADRSVEALLNYISTGLTFDTWSTAGSTFDTLPSTPYDSAYWLSGAQALSAFNTSHQLQMLNGASASSSMTTAEAGDDDMVSLLKRVRLRYASGYGPSAAAIQTHFKMNSGDAFTNGDSGTIDDGKFDMLKSARWHRAAISFTGPVRVTHVDAEIIPVSKR